MKKLMFLVIFILSTTTVFASDCANLSGIFRVHMQRSEVQLEVTQDECSSITFNWQYINGSVITKTYFVDGSPYLTFDDGNKVIYEAASWKEIPVGLGLKRVLHIEETGSYVSGDPTTPKTILFYEQQGSARRSIVERRKHFDDNGEVFKTFYVGYLEDL
ncbi:MAG: hypothetical protein HON90_08485 [Halobacteriovoraceae bacterium]|jgi:hypothetical protein|nr:hypothetical protein [Halobacteriovoraceae bacterium]